MTYSGGICKLLLVGTYPGQERAQVAAGELPLERPGRDLIVVLEAEESVLEVCQRVEIVGS